MGNASPHSVAQHPDPQVSKSIPKKNYPDDGVESPVAESFHQIEKGKVIFTSKIDSHIASIWYLCRRRFSKKTKNEEV